MTNIYRPKRLLVYVVPFEDGLAPNVTGGICTLTVCKPTVRRVARLGEDWIVGMSVRKNGHDINQMIYTMQVEEKVPFEAYFTDPRFQGKKPDKGDKSGDNFFARLKGDGPLQVVNRYAQHNSRPDKIQADLKSPYSVIAETFWYYGAEAPKLPPSLCATRVVQGHRRGHRVITDKDTINRFYRWLTRRPTGIHGKPRDP